MNSSLPVCWLYSSESVLENGELVRVLSPQGTPALFLILLLLNDSMLVAYVEDKRSVELSILVRVQLGVRIWFQ